MQRFGIIFTDVPESILPANAPSGMDSAFPVEFVNTRVVTHPSLDEVLLSSGEVTLEFGKENAQRFFDRNRLIVVEAPEQESEFLPDGRTPQAILDAVAPRWNEVFVSLVHGVFDTVTKIAKDNIEMVTVVHEEGL